MLWAQASSRHLRLAEGPGGLVINLPCTLSCPSLAFHQPQAFYCSWPEQPRSVSVSQHQDLFDDSEGDWSEFTEGAPPGLELGSRSGIGALSGRSSRTRRLWAQDCVNGNSRNLRLEILSQDALLFESEGFI